MRETMHRYTLSDIDDAGAQCYVYTVFAKGRIMRKSVNEAMLRLSHDWYQLPALIFTLEFDLSRIIHTMRDFISFKFRLHSINAKSTLKAEKFIRCNGNCLKIPSTLETINLFYTDRRNIKKWIWTI